jgi:hypothetical protein
MLEILEPDPEGTSSSSDAERLSDEADSALLVRFLLGVVDCQGLGLPNLRSAGSWMFVTRDADTSAIRLAMASDSQSSTVGIDTIPSAFVTGVLALVSWLSCWGVLGSDLCLLGCSVVLGVFFLADRDIDLEQLEIE